jgi:hypothetical protein
MASTKRKIWPGEAKEQSRMDESKRQAENLLNEIGILAKKQGLNIKRKLSNHLIFWQRNTP